MQDPTTRATVFFYPSDDLLEFSSMEVGKNLDIQEKDAKTVSLEQLNEIDAEMGGDNQTRDNAALVKSLFHQLIYYYLRFLSFIIIFNYTFLHQTIDNAVLVKQSFIKTYIYLFLST